MNLLQIINKIDYLKIAAHIIINTIKFVNNLPSFTTKTYYSLVPNLN